MGEVIDLFANKENIEVRPISLFQPDMVCRGCGKFAPFEAYSPKYHIRLPFCGDRRNCWPQIIRQIKNIRASLAKLKLAGCPKDFF